MLLEQMPNNGDLTEFGARTHVIDTECQSLTSIACMAIEEVGVNQDEPICLVDIGALKRQYELWQSSFQGRIHPYYAVKCNPDPRILRTLADLGANFDCASEHELRLVLSHGIAADRILFANPCKFRSHLAFARDHGVSKLTFDSVNELIKTKEIHPAAELILRLRVEDHKSQCPMSMKFGARYDDWEKLLRKAQELGLNIVGVSFHVGSGCTTLGSFAKAIADAKAIFKLGEKFGFKDSMRLLDIGGGFPGDGAQGANILHEDSNSDKENIDIGVETIPSKIAAEGDKGDKKPMRPTRVTPDVLWNSMVSEILMAISDPIFGGKEFIAEPGRFFAHRCTSLITKVFGVTKLEYNNKFRYFLSDGVYGSFNNIIYDHAVVKAPTPLLAQPAYAQNGKDCFATKVSSSISNSRLSYTSLLFGPTCDGFDLIMETILPELKEGDYLLWADMGAYTQAAATRFNGMALPKKWYFEGLEAGVS